MARAKVVHSQDAVAVIFEGDKAKREEPSEGRIVFPGGSIAVSRTSDGNYWAHFNIMDREHATPTLDALGEIADARIDRVDEHASIQSGEPLRDPKINHVAILVRPIRDWKW